MSGCHSGRDDADFLLVVMIAICVRHHDNCNAANLTEGPPSFLAVRLSVREQHHEPVAKHSGCVFKTDAVLFLVREVLGLVPFKIGIMHKPI
jgi:hypothetical protein